MEDMKEMFSTLARMSERQCDNLTEMRLQTAHQEHIAKQAENVTLILTLMVRVSVELTDEANESLSKLVKDFQRESIEWRERVELLTVDRE